MNRRRVLTGLGCIALLWLLANWGRSDWGSVAVAPSLEARLPDGSPYTPSTQSFLRGLHWLEGVEAADIELDSDDLVEIDLLHKDRDDSLKVVNLPADQLVPRLHYTPPDKPDAFDAFNLMMAEFARNSLSVPIGKRGDSMAHFETTLEEGYPWQLGADYEFAPNTRFRPVRMGVVNNCLAAGLWELSATDRSGEIYHAWLRVPVKKYVALVARTNGLDRDFVDAALKWRTKEVPVELERLRRVDQELGTVAAALTADDTSGYSSQDSRRKLAMGYALVELDGGLKSPERLRELTERPVHLSEFVEPGRYSAEKRRRFDLGFLRNVKGARVARTTALTSYDWRNRPLARPTIEIAVDLGEWRLLIGNLPLELLVPQEDFALHGFGVGVMDSSGIAERRAFLVAQGPPPSFAYLCRKRGDRLMAVNSHDYGIEQLFLRTLGRADPPALEITITSYERIVDIVKYRVEVPKELRAELKEAALNYQAPLYRTYRDDNLR